MASQPPGTDDSIADLGLRRLEAADEAVRRWASRGAAVEDSDGVVSYSAGLVAAVKDLISLRSGGGGLYEIALQVAMVHLEDDFRQVLTLGTYLYPPSSLQESLHDCIAPFMRSFSFSSIPNLEDLSFSSFSTSPSGESRSYGTGYSSGPVCMEKVHMYLIDPEASIYLKEIAELMILAGHAPNMCRDYGETRHNMLMQCLSLLGVQIEQKSHNNQAEATANGACSMQLYEKNQKMWIQALRVVVSIVLPEERDACAQIFGCDRKVEEDCFARATTGCTGQLLAVGSMMTNVKVNDQQYHKVPLLLQMHEELVKLQPSINVLMSGDAKGVISEQASLLLDKLGEEASSLLLEFLNVYSNLKPCQHKVLDGDILPLTRHVIIFIELLVEYNDTINHILPRVEDDDEGKGKEQSTKRTKSRWERYVLMLLARLQLKVEENAESYEDERMRYIFLMNNAMHVVKGSGSPDLSMSMGNDNHQQLVIRVEQYATAYLRASWTEALLQLSDHGVSKYSVNFGPGSVSQWMRKSMKNFNSAFGEISRVQTTWKVPNPQLRQHLRLIILQQVLNAYRTLLGRYGCCLGKNPSKYIKYTPDDIENHVLDLFEG
ncbi:unnamed protein product [Triticum turgidum subsp. durum]|uniref:Exocyst subunit Exo70 family protein n=1 Tax=Triticum turgidum subsp. durum TaxID=4567 RepID=A0A9R1REB0_TRITD|nr:unnamed protein product [Triticum turgidum subsp. durum]